MLTEDDCQAWPFCGHQGHRICRAVEHIAWGLLNFIGIWQLLGHSDENGCCDDHDGTQILEQNGKLSTYFTKFNVLFEEDDTPNQDDD